MNTPQITLDKNLATGRVRAVVIVIGVTEYRRAEAGDCAPRGNWFGRCTLYTDSEWITVSTLKTAELDALAAEALATYGAAEAALKARAGAAPAVDYLATVMDMWTAR